MAAKILHDENTKDSKEIERVEVEEKTSVGELKELKELKKNKTKKELVEDIIRHCDEGRWKNAQRLLIEHRANEGLAGTIFLGLLCGDMKAEANDAIGWLGFMQWITTAFRLTARKFNWHQESEFKTGRSQQLWSFLGGIKDGRMEYSLFMQSFISFTSDEVFKRMTEANRIMKTEDYCGLYQSSFKTEYPLLWNWLLHMGFLPPC